MARRPAILAADFGASSGRVMAVTYDGERLFLGELHRFPTDSTTSTDGIQRWDLHKLIGSLEAGLTKAAQARDLNPQSIGIDTWGVDFALCPPDALPEPPDWPVCYRDGRHAGYMEKLGERLGRRRIFEQTGVQFLPFNSLYQLAAACDAAPPDAWNGPKRLRFMPDLFHFQLCGATVSEFSMATTSQFFDPTSGDWARALLRDAALPDAILQDLVRPGAILGDLAPACRKRTGLGAIPIIAVATHDTGSAFAAAPLEDPNAAIISSGTWSLVGFESPRPVIGDEAFGLNVSNEGSADGGFRVLKNVTGLWPLQQCRDTWWPQNPPDFATLCDLADDAEPMRSLIDPDHPSLLNPADMPQAIVDLCRQSGQPVPDSKPRIVRCILESLAVKTARVLNALRPLCPHPIERIHVIGGGSQNARLNQWLADASGLPVIAGPSEATALGNALVQAVALGWVRDLGEGRALIANSVTPTRFEPQPGSDFAEALSRQAMLFFPTD